MPRNDDTTRLASGVLRFRRARTRFLPYELFDEPAWDLLLELFVADAEGRRLTGRDVCRSVGVAPSVLSRWLMHLTKCDMIVGDGSGDLDDPLTISGTALERMEAMFRYTSALRLAPD